MSDIHNGKVLVICVDAKCGHCFLCEYNKEKEAK